MAGKTVHIKSFGCQMNKLDTALVAAALTQAGYSLTDRIKDADAVLINTCSVRQHAEQRVLSHLGHLKHIKKSRPELVVGIIGCMAQRLGPELLSHDVVDLVCGPAEIPQLLELLGNAFAHSSNRLAITDRIRQPDPSKNCALERFESTYGLDGREIPGQAFVRVMRGCNNFCTYCIVPYVRGPAQCRAPEAILQQIKKLADQGVKQVTLLGQTINAYQYQQSSKRWSLADLLAAAAEIDGIHWIKFVTSYPTERFFDDILQVMAESPKVCPYLHLPAQSGSDRILRAMNRHYTASQYLELLERARQIVPDLAVAGDFIVGFPGETDEDFQATVELTKRARYKNAFIFKYSPRPGTTADKRLADNVPPHVKQQRNIELLKVQEQISRQLSRQFLGKQLQVLVEGPSKKANRTDPPQSDHIQLVGRTASDWIVVFDGPARLAGQFVKVQVTDTTPLTLLGHIIEP